MKGSLAVGSILSDERLLEAILGMLINLVTLTDIIDTNGQSGRGFRAHAFAACNKEARKPDTNGNISLPASSMAVTSRLP